MQKGRAASTLSAMSTLPLLLLYDADVLHPFLPLHRKALPGVPCSHLKAIGRTGGIPHPGLR